MKAAGVLVGRAPEMTSSRAPGGGAGRPCPRRPGHRRGGHRKVTAGRGGGREGSRYGLRGADRSGDRPGGSELPYATLRHRPSSAGARVVPAPVGDGGVSAARLRGRRRPAVGAGGVDAGDAGPGGPTLGRCDDRRPDRLPGQQPHRHSGAAGRDLSHRSCGRRSPVPARRGHPSRRGCPPSRCDRWRPTTSRSSSRRGPVVQCLPSWRRPSRPDKREPLLRRGAVASSDLSGRGLPLSLREVLLRTVERLARRHRRSCG